jgi:hypothetical protein
MCRFANQGCIGEGRVLIAWRRRTSNSLDGKRAIDTTRTAVSNVIVGRFEQILRSTELEEACEETTRLAGFGNGLPCGESLGVFSN